ncbi:MAG TPA: hypothetical protein VJQ85_04850 [Gaiellaceae bacterium]|nr:hypothetical protein [Gaiellaceae bacterium]
MNTLASQQTRARAAALSDRFLAAVPLASVYVWLSAVYIVEAWRRPTPWLFGDELEFTQLGRSIAATGHPAERGTPHGADSIYSYLTSLFWHVHSVAAAYAAIKYVDVLLMVAVVFPTYFLARMIVGKTAALFAAAGAGAIPSLAYSSYIVEEPIAYPYAAVCFFVMAKAFVTRSRRWIIAAVVLAVLAPVVRTELAVVPAALALAFLFLLWSSDAGRRWRGTWSIGDWIGVVVLVFGAIFLFTGIGSHHSDEIQRVTRAYKHRMIVQGDWAAATLALGIGVLPFMAGLAALVRAKGESRALEVRAFRSVAAAAIVTFGLYTAIKAAYLSTAFATRVEERNLIYVTPLLFIGTAFLFSRRRVNWYALAVAAGYTSYLVVYALYHVTQYPYQMGVQLYSDALGFAIVQQANRDIGWTPDFVRNLMIVMSVLSVLVLVAVALLRKRTTVVAAIAASAAVGVIGWSFTGELAASAGTNSIARQAAATLKRPFTWVDDATGGASTLYLGQEEVDQNPEWLLEFWNRSITRVSSLDGTLGGPGLAGGPNFTRGGVLYQGDDVQAGAWRNAYAVEDLPCIELAGQPVASHPYRGGGLILRWELVRLDQPDRMVSDCMGIYPDGWSSANDSVYYRYGGPAGWLRIAYSRPENYPIPRTPVRITLGTMKIVDQQPALVHATKTVNTAIGNLQSKVVWLRVPAGGFAVHVVVAKKFVPDDYDHRGDKRELGVQLSYDWSRTRPHR